MRSAPPTAQIHPWIFPARAWSRIHVDFAGPISGQMYMVVVDAYSKFPEVVKILLLEQLSLHCVIHSAGTDRLKFLFLTTVPSSLQKNLKSFALTMEFYIVLQQRTNHPPMVRLNVLSRF